MLFLSPASKLQSLRNATPLAKCRCIPCLQLHERVHYSCSSGRRITGQRKCSEEAGRFREAYADIITLSCCAASLPAALRRCSSQLERRTTGYKVEAVEVRKPEELQGLHGLVIPGGESTTMANLAQRNGLVR